MEYSIKPIAYIETPYKQKFSIPRQGLALSSAKGQIIFENHIDVSQSLNGIDGFSHLWLLFVLHENIDKGFKSMVRPPRLGGNAKIGVFASRSSFRPNHIGMSLVTNLGLHNKVLSVGGVDLLNQTPIVDIKPYLPYADNISNASASYAEQKPIKKLQIQYSTTALSALKMFKNVHHDLDVLIQNVIEQDPRPSYKQNKPDDKVYFIQLYDYEITWQVNFIEQVHDVPPSQQQQVAQIIEVKKIV